MINNLFIISGPSGSGQDSVIEGLAEIMPIERVITTTTRMMRPGEKQGQPYYFISKAEFKKKIKQDLFLEYAEEYNGHYYGVLKKEIIRVKQSHKIGIWKIEYQGVMSVKKKWPAITAILINAPLNILIQRIKAREKDKATARYLKERIAYTKEWLKHKNIYDYEVINRQGKLDETVREVVEIIKENTN